jgi:hypothetical protein
MSEPLSAARQLLNDQYEKTIAHCADREKWYKDNVKKKTLPSKVIRFASIILIGLGGIFPLIGGSFKDYGYISIATAGVLLFLDRFFGFSSGWIRYILIEMEIGKRKKEFEIKWRIEMAKIDLRNAEITIENAIELMNMLKDFSCQIEELVMQETNTWAAEFQSNISELQKMASEKMEALKPGSIKIVIKKSGTYKSLKILTDGIERKETPGTEALIDNVSPGSHEIRVVTVPVDEKDQSKTITAVVVVEANKMAIVEVAIPE